MSSQTTLLYLYISLIYCFYVSGASGEAQIKDISNTTSSCHPLDSCEPLPAEGPAVGHKRSCRCDSLCPVYGDCCRDAELYDADVQRRNALAHRCERLVEYGDTYIRAQCREDWQDVLGMELCDRAEIGFIRQDMTLDLPVTSLESGITYANIHCAICNYDISNLARWQPHLDCPIFPQNYSREEIKNRLHYNKDNAAWEMVIENEVSLTCEVYPEAPESVIGHLRRCESAEASCASNWTDPHTQELCLNHMARVYATAGDSEFYRNRFCAICNYIRENNITCEKPFFESLYYSFGFDLKYFATNGYSNLLNFDTLFEENLPIETKILVTGENGSVESIGKHHNSYTHLESELSDYAEDYHIDKVSTTSPCYPLDSCEPLPLEDPAAELKRTCRCDSLCTVYDDCCRDAEIYNSDIQRHSPLAHTCVKFMEYDNIYIRAQCREDWQDDLKREMCDNALVGREEFSDLGREESPDWNIRQKVALDLPVTSLHTFITYANIHCAICNEDFNNLARWRTHLQCYGMPQNYSREVVKTNLHYNESWKVAVEDKIFECEVYPVAPESVIARGLLRQCDRTEASCSPNWTDPYTQELCLNHKARVYSMARGSRVYRNRFCAACNYIRENDIACEKQLFLRTLDFDIGRFITNGYSNLLIWDTLFEENFTIEKNLDDIKGNGSVEHIEKKYGSDVIVSVLPDFDGDPPFDQYKQCITLKNGNKLCIYKELDTSTVVLSFISLTCLVLSSVCLIIHLVVFMIVPDLKNLSGKNLASYCIALLAADVTLILGYFGEPGEIECFIIAILKYYFFLASFMWLVIMSSDICWTIMQSIKQLKKRSGSQRQKFLTYTVCGWLLPIPLLCMAVILDTLDTNYLNGFPLGMIPEFGKFNCWFGQPQSLLVFFGIPLALTMLLCTIFFIYSANIVHQTKSAVQKSSSGNQQIFMLYIRLALLSGLSWIIGLVAACINIVALKYIVVILNAPQGLFILFAFTCTSKTSRGLQKSFARMRCCLFCCGSGGLCNQSEVVNRKVSGSTNRSTINRKVSGSTNQSSDTQLSSV